MRELTIEVEEDRFNMGTRFGFSLTRDIAENPKFMFQVVRRIADMLGEELFKELTDEKKRELISDPEIKTAIGEVIVKKLSEIKDVK